MVLVVEIEDQALPKPFLGGWRDVARDLEYHDATSQTPLDFFSSRGKSLVSRTIQTSAVKEQRSVAITASIQGIERAIQADCPGFPEVGERFLEARDWKEMERKERAAVGIQRFYRAYRKRKLQHKHDHGDDNEEKLPPLRKSVHFVEEDDQEFDESVSISPSQEYESFSRDFTELQILHPLHHSSVHIQSPSDISVARNLLNRWSAAEEMRIHETYPEESRDHLNAHARRLEYEVEILRAIDNSRSEISRRRSARTRAKFLDELSRPVDIEVPIASEKKNKSTVHIETLDVQRAREFRDLYESLLVEEDEYLNEIERIDLLLTLKKLLGQHSCTASSSLENLIDQELFLLSSRVEPARMKNLRSRVRLGFLRLARGALRHDKRNQDTSRTQLCPSCCKLKKLEAFKADHREKISRTCVNCEALRLSRRETDTYQKIYERMLKELRRSEAARPDGANSLAFMVGPKAIGYLVNDIWHGRSAISECSDLERLRLVRLDPGKPWTPWNTLLSTRREARMHEALVRNSAAAQVYDRELLRKFCRMNLQARLYFDGLAKSTESAISL